MNIDNRWILRIARNRWAADGYAIEAKLLPRLAPSLPAPVPAVLWTGRRWALTRYIAGEPIDEHADAALGANLASFLAALHRFPAADARRLGVRAENRAEDIESFRTLVLPLLNDDERRLGDALLAEHARAEFEPALTHADLGPAHVLVTRGRLAGVIDWTDVRVGDPAIDLAWSMHGTPEPFATALASSYGVDPQLARRAHVYHALGPWHEVVHGLRNDRRFVASGLTGVRSRLRAAAEGEGTMAR